jgi:ribosomal protein S18 acetylase RimI-like enzyme
MSILYRIANGNDAEELKRLNDEFNGDGSNTVENIRKGLERKDAETVFVAQSEHVLLGFCCGQLLKSICYSVFYVEITELYVTDSYRKLGIGRNLVSYAEEWYRKQDIHDFQLFTGKENTDAQKFYERIGYRRHEDVLYRKRDRWKEHPGE